MFNLEQYPSILFHFKNLSRIFKLNNSGWYEIFCPYCDDSTRKANPNHGHFNISKNYPFCHCFRCGFRGNLIKVLIDTGFNDSKLLDELKVYGKITYNSNKKINILNNNQNNLYLKLDNYISNFANNNKKDFNIWKYYINNRCGEINPIYYYLIPNYINNQLVVQILNNSNKIVTNRFIFPKEKRYYIPNEKNYYYFQNIYNILNYDNIVICEGAFDLINLHKYSLNFNNNNSFYLSMGGSNYKNVISSLISNFLLIGKYTINIVFDKNVENKDQLIYNINQISLNPDISFKFYEPILYKDVSDCISLIKL